MLRIKVRGIYSTGLVKFFLERGYTIVYPSEKQKERFGLGDDIRVCDAKIEDIETLQGIKIDGPFAEDVGKEIQEEFEGFLRRRDVGKIISGEIIGRIYGKPIVRAKKFVGILEEPGKKGKRVLVQIKGFRDGTPIFTRNIRIFGKYCWVCEGEGITFSKEISEKEVERLSEIEEIKGFQIHLRSFSIGREIEEIKMDIGDCIEKYKEIKERFESGEDVEVKSGSFAFYFTREGREKVEEHRRQVVPTMKKHILLRALGYQEIIDVCEELNPERAYEVLEKRETTQEIEIYHNKVIGENRIILKRKLVEKRDGFLRGFKVVNVPGFYDGLGERKIPGDYIITEIKEGEWYIKHEYYRKDGKLIGKYYSINTPVEIFGTKVNYIDLEVDVAVKEEPYVIDYEEFELLIEECVLPEKLKKIVDEKIKEVMKIEAKRS